MMGALQRAIADACLSANADEELTRDPRGFFAGHGVAPEDVEAIVVAPARLLVYRSLVRNGLSSVVSRLLPRTRARMNAACAGRFDADFAAFVDQVGPHTHYLRDVPSELFAWAEPRWRSDPRVPPYLPDLAAHELAHFAVATSESTRAVDHGLTAADGVGHAVHVAEVALDRPLAFVQSARIVRYGWAVHELSPDKDATDEPAERTVRLVAYRDTTHAVRWLDLTPLAAAIVERLIRAEALGTAVQGACAEHATAPADVLPDVARLLADLGVRGVLV